MPILGGNGGLPSFWQSIEPYRLIAFLISIPAAAGLLVAGVHRRLIRRQIDFAGAKWVAHQDRSVLLTVVQVLCIQDLGASGFCGG